MKLNEKEFTEWLISGLPDEPSDAARNHPELMEELGRPLLIYYRDSVPDEEDIEYFCNGVVPRVKYHWGSRCLCTECGERFVAGYDNEKVIIRMGEDGCAYTGYISPYEPDGYSFREGEDVRCPMCDAVLRATRKASIRNERTLRTQVAELINADGIGCIMFWIAQRYLTKEGYSRVEFLPREAIAVTPGGSLRRFAKTKKYMTSESYLINWEMRTIIKDPSDIEFMSEGMRKCGALFAEPEKDVLTGTTAEKTGLEAYFGRSLPVVYMKIWKKYKNIENLVRTGWAAMAESIVLSCVSGYGYYGATQTVIKKTEEINWQEAKPHRMLGLTKADYKALAGEWSIRHLKAFQKYEKLWPGTSPVEVNEWMLELGSVGDFEASSPCWDADLRKVLTYVRKQCEKCQFYDMREAMQQYIDYLRLQAEVNMVAETGAMTRAEQYPPNLRTAHDRQLRIRRNLEQEISDKKKDNQYGARFETVHEVMKSLEWTDGNICVVIPQKPSDLVREGHTLNHCVGGYSEQHVSGKPIFFIRHARRPERSWYTLNENLKGEKPERIQLHGYGNEWAHGKRLTIPKEVLIFINRWEREILAPWYENNKGKVTA